MSHKKKAAVKVAQAEVEVVPVETHRRRHARKRRWLRALLPQMFSSMVAPLFVGLLLQGFKSHEPAAIQPAPKLAIVQASTPDRADVFATAHLEPAAPSTPKDIRTVTSLKVAIPGDRVGDTLPHAYTIVAPPELSPKSQMR